MPPGVLKSTVKPRNFLFFTFKGRFYDLGKSTRFSYYSFFFSGLIYRTRVYAFNQFGRVFLLFLFFIRSYNGGGWSKCNNSELYSFTTNNISRLFSSRLDDLHFPCFYSLSETIKKSALAIYERIHEK